MCYYPRMVEPAQPPKTASMLGIYPPIDDGTVTRAEGLLSDVRKPEPLKDYTLTVEVRRNSDGEVGREEEQMSLIDIADGPELVMLGGMLGVRAHEQLNTSD